MIVILGPTASGKTDLGIKLAKERNGAVISADSRQLYKGMNIGTAKPELNNSSADGVEHYGFDMREPDNLITLAEWQREAFAMIDDVIARNMTPLLVGGTMLYIDSVVDNYDIPAVGPNKQLRRKLEKKPADELYEELLRKDPAAKIFIEPGNKRRIIRALEVIEATGNPFSEQRKKREPRYDVEMVGLFPGWDKLRDRITKRARQMLEAGLIDETRRLQEKYGKDLSLLQTMNYKQAAAVLENKMTEQEAVEEMIKVNMRYARRQMSWWRRRKDIRWFTNSKSVFSEY
ncbi:MAG: tRNA (adenosine(37)-N6)-dimethylallyltransferase MiaA [bacterium]